MIARAYRAVQVGRPLALLPGPFGDHGSAPRPSPLPRLPSDTVIPSPLSTVNNSFTRPHPTRPIHHVLSITSENREHNNTQPNHPTVPQHLIHYPLTNHNIKPLSLRPFVKGPPMQASVPRTSSCGNTQPVRQPTDQLGHTALTQYSAVYRSPSFPPPPSFICPPQPDPRWRPLGTPTAVPTPDPVPIRRPLFVSPDQLIQFQPGCT